MKTPLLAVSAALMLAACGSEPAGPIPPGSVPSSSSSSAASSSTSSSSSSSSSASSSSGSPGVAVGGICEVDTAVPAATHLVVISAEQYQQRLEQLLSWQGGDTLATAMAPYAGSALLVEEHAEQRMALALETFYRNAEMIAAQARAVSCTDLSAADCGARFIDEFVEPLFARPMFAEERDRYLAFFTQADNPETDGQTAAMITALSSPHFLFRLETRDE